MAFTVLTAIFGITSLGNGRTQVYDPIFLVPELCAVALLVLFVRHTRSAAAPFIPVRLLVGKGFAVMNWVNLLHGVVTFGVASLVPLYAEQRYHLAALSAGTLLTARAVGMIAVGTVAAFALRRTGYRLPMMLGFSTVALGTLLMSVSPRWGVSPYVWLSVSVGIAGLGLGAVNPAASNACLQLAPDQAAAITGLRVMFINLGVIFSVSVTTAILNRSSTPGHHTSARLLGRCGGRVPRHGSPLPSCPGAQRRVVGRKRKSRRSTRPTGPKHDHVDRIGTSGLQSGRAIR